MAGSEDYVLVTGASRNIGKGIATRLHQDGYKVIMMDVIAPEDPSLGEFVSCDLSNIDKTAAVLAQITQDRPITRLVNCAGLFAQGKVEDVNLADFDRIFAVNTRACMQIVQALVPAMRAAKFGRIVNITSRSALGISNLTLYSATKGALSTLTRTWALELAADGITVNGIGPGTTESAMFEAAYPKGSAAREAYLQGVPMKRAGTPEDIAHATSFFLDARAGYITGQIVYIDGGVSVGRAPL